MQVRATFALLCCAVLGAPAPRPVLLGEDFGGPAGDFVTEAAFYGTEDSGVRENAEWFAESGRMVQDGGAGRTTSEVFRMWTRRDDLRYPTVRLELVLHGFVGGDQPWHGVNLWLNQTLCSPSPECTRVDDGEGTSGYALEFANRDGTVTVLKKVAGDTRSAFPEGATSYVEGGTYYELVSRRWSPEPGRWYSLEAQAVDLGDGGTLLRTTVDGEVVLEVVDDGSVGGPRLEQGGRVGVRSDYADLQVDGLRVLE